MDEKCFALKNLHDEIVTDDKDAPTVSLISVIQSQVSQADIVSFDIHLVPNVGWIRIFHL